jgi:alternative ribosome-rescue factor
MKKKTVNNTVKSTGAMKGSVESELGRGVIKDNFLKALVTSKVYKMQIVKAKKGKGSYQRKAKNIKGESYLIAA